MRDGLQNPSVIDPPVEAKIEILQLMNDVGIHGANVGLPSSSERAFADVVTMCKEIDRQKLQIVLTDDVVKGKAAHRRGGLFLVTLVDPDPGAQQWEHRPQGIGRRKDVVDHRWGCT